MKKIPGLIMSLIALGFLAWAPGVYAAYEIVGVTSNVPTDGTVVKMQEDVEVSWPKPDMTGGDVLQGFVYKWNTSASPLSEAELSASVNDGIVSSSLDDPFLSKAAADFANDDSNLLRYVHIKTWYLDSSSGQPFTYSEDTVIGPINIDNVAPTGTVQIVDDQGDDLTSTQSTSVSLKMAASLAPVKMYIGESDVRPTTGTDYATDAVYNLSSTEGLKTIRVWFEDAAGNISSAPATDTVTLLATLSISPYNPTIDLATATSQVFRVDDGDTQSLYDWVIIEEAPVTAGDDVADFSGTSTGTNSVTISLVKPGTFKLQATPSAGGTALTSGTITVTGAPGKKGDADGNDTVDATDALYILYYYAGNISASDLKNDCDVDKNGSIDATDALYVLHLYAGNITSFP